MHETQAPRHDLDLTERLRRLARYGAGWDGYRAETASPAAVEEACAFVAALGRGEGLEAALEPDGSVNLAGDFGGARLLLAFEGNGAVAVSRRADGAWTEIGTYPLRETGGRVTVPAVLRALTAGLAQAA